MIGYRQGLFGKTTLICSRVSHSRNLDRRLADRHLNRDMALVDRFMTGQSIMARRRSGIPAVVTLAAMAALAALTAGAAASDTTAGAPQHRIATMDCAVMN